MKSIEQARAEGERAGLERMNNDILTALHGMGPHTSEQCATVIRALKEPK